MALRFPITPMKAVLAGLPAEIDDDQWAYEIKWDGYRTLAFIGDGRLRLQSSSGIDVSAKYPEIAGLTAATNATSAIFDGELVVLDDQGRPSFEGLQRHENSAAFYAFDLLQLNGQDTIGLDYLQRRSLLAGALEAGSHWMAPSYRIGGGHELAELTAARGLEGVIAKRTDSLYVPGKRSTSWRKVKHRRREVVVIGGFSRGTGSRQNTFGALLVGVPEGGRALRFAGGVGTGFTQATLEDLCARMAALVSLDCPFEPEPPRAYRQDAVWITPALRATIEIAEWTNEGYVRHASFIHLES